MTGDSAFKNLLANYFSKLWGFISIYVFIPQYIKYLGVEAYAVISFYTVILGVISFADAGLSSAITREFARVGDASYKYSVLKVVEKIFILICILLLTVLIVLSPIIAAKWLNTSSISLINLSYYLKLIAIGVVLQMFSSIYYGGLMGIHAQVKANLIQVLWAIARTVGSIALFIVYKPTLEVFFVWQIICNVVLICSLRISLIKILKTGGAMLKIVLKKLPVDVKTYIGGMLLISIVSAINIQADKIATSSLFNLEQFGYYSLSSSLAQVAVLMTAPLASTVFPILSRFTSEHKNEALVKCFTNFSFIFGIIVLPITLLLEFYTKEILITWLGNTAFAPSVMKEIVTIVRLLVVGGMFLALQVLPFYFLLAQGKTRYTVRQGVVQILFGLPALYYCINKYGLTGAGIPWIIINLGSFIYLNTIIFKKYLKLNPLVFFFEVSILPMLISLLIVFVGWYMFKGIPNKYFLIAPLTIGAVCVGTNILVYNLKRGNKAFEIKKLLKF